MTELAYVAGVGMTPFRQPQKALDWQYTEMAKTAGTAALEDAGVSIGDIEAAFASYVMGDSCSGHRAVYELGPTGIPIYNVNSNCSSGSSALSLARQTIRSGQHDIVLCLGFEQMTWAAPAPEDRPYPCGLHVEAATVTYRYLPEVAWSPQIFANAGREHMERYGSRPEHFAMVGEKNHRHSALNPFAQFREVSTLEEVMEAKVIHAPVTRLQCSPISSGSAAVVLMSERAIRERGLEAQAVAILGQGVTSDSQASFSGSAILAVGADMSQRAAHGALAEAEVAIEDVDVIELHDCFSPNEILTYEALGLAPEGKGHLLLEDGATTYGGRCVVNPSGGLIGKGHPLGATGLAQCTELTWHLRGTAGDRQVAGAELALQHNLGLGGTAVVTVYRAPGSL